MYKSFFKRVLDICVAFFSLVLLFPFLVTLTIVLTILYKGNPFFFQTRPGKNGKCFNIIKFRTMNRKRDEWGTLLPDSERMIPIGNWLRKNSIDELPQLVNILTGTMSLIGPRPLLVEYLPVYSEEQKKRHDVRPGITGWAQVNGRNAITWSEKFEYDIWYVNHLSFKLDTKIFFLTIKKIFDKEGINNSENVTMPKFNGHN